MGAGATVKKAAFVAKKAYEKLPAEMKDTTAGEALDYVGQQEDFQGAEKYMELKVAGKMHYLYWKSEQTGDNCVNFAMLHLVAPENYVTERMVAKMILTGVVGFSESKQSFFILNN